MVSREQWFGLKVLIKQIVRFVPGYNRYMHWLSAVLGERAWARRIPVVDEDVKVHVAGHTFWMVRPDRCEIAKQLFWSHGVRAPREDAATLELFASLCMDTDLVLDIGCNTGLFALTAAAVKPTARIVGFDIIPEAIQLFMFNILRNNYCAVTPLLRGVGVPSTTFRVPVKIGGSSLPTALSTDFKSDSGVDIPIISLDSLLEFRPETGKVLIKIDVEATEHNIFEYGMEFIRACKPVFICELLPRAQVLRFERLLSSCGYSFYLITDSGLVRKKSLTPDHRYRDWLFTQESYPDGLCWRISGKGVPAVGGAKGESSGGETPDAQPYAHNAQGSTEVCGYPKLALLRANGEHWLTAG